MCDHNGVRDAWCDGLSLCAITESHADEEEERESTGMQCELMQGLARVC